MKRIEMMINKIVAEQLKWEAEKRVRKNLKLTTLPSGDQPSLLIED